MSLFRRVVLLNATVFVVGIVVLAVTPAPVTFPVTLTGAIVLFVGLVAILVANLFVVRFTFAPLDRLRNLMRSVDLLRPGQRLEVTGPPEIRELVAVFNEMLDRLEYERRESSRRALAAQEAERKRVAQELHDEIGQALTAVLLLLTGLENRVRPELGVEVRQAQETARKTLEDVRRVARQLRPEALDDLGLVSALTSLTTAFARQTGIRVRRRIDLDLPQLADDVELVLYRVAQESLTNVARHAEASHVELVLEADIRGVTLRVSDDGVGMGSRDGSGGGISGMRERALLVEGDFRIRNRPGGGVEVTLVVAAEGGP
jgi:two-component system, NarL family, sensor histidine kinase UhpB